MTTDPLREQIQRAVEKRSVQAVAADLGVSRSALGSYLMGRAHRGTVALITLRSSTLVTPTQEPERK